MSGYINRVRKIQVCMVFVMLLSLSFLFIGSSIFAGSSWLDNGKNMLNQLSKQPSSGAAVGGLSDSEIGAGLKEALRVGSETVVANLGKIDGFNSDSVIHIPLPDELQSVKKALSKVGLSDMLDDLELRLNRAAEAATPKAKELFGQAISDMSIEDVQKIYKGSDDAATQYFRSKMTPELTKEMTPVVAKSLSQVGAIKAYDEVMGEYKNIPFMPNVEEDLNGYVVEKGMDGIFYYLAQEEAAIRSDPVKQSTALLKKLFGGQ